MDGPFDYIPPSYRQAHKDNSGTFWNMLSSVFGQKPKYSESVNRNFEALRKNAEHYRKLNEAAKPKSAPDATTKYVPKYGKRK
jgi:hypothetical protein